MFEAAEDFFSSIGLFNMTDVFWERSVINQTEWGKPIVCHASAEDFCLGPKGNDYRYVVCQRTLIALSWVLLLYCLDIFIVFLTLLYLFLFTFYPSIFLPFFLSLLYISSLFFISFSFLFFLFCIS